MIIRCENCYTKFYVSDQDIGIAGRTVRCGKCCYSWYQEVLPPNSVVQQSVEEEIVHSPSSAPSVAESVQVANLPSVVVRRPLREAFCFFAMSFFLAAFITSITFANEIMEYFPQSEPYYQALGVVNTHGVAVADVTVEKHVGADINSLLVDGVLVNTTGYKKVVPHVRIRLYNASGGLLRSYFQKELNGELGKNDQFAFSSKVSPLPEDAYKVVVDVGNVLDMFLK